MRPAWALGVNYDRSRLKMYSATGGFILGEAILGTDLLGAEGAPVEIAADYTSITLNTPTTVENGLFVHREVETCQLTATVPARVDLRRKRIVIAYDGVQLYKGTIRQVALTETVEVGAAAYKAGNTAVKTYRLTLLATSGEESLASAATPARDFLTASSSAARIASWTGLTVLDYPAGAATDLPVNVDNVGFDDIVWRRITTADDMPTLLDTLRNEAKLRNRTFTYRPWEANQITLWPNNRWVNGAATAATALTFTDDPADDVDALGTDQFVHAGQHVSYSTRTTGEDPALFADSVTVSMTLYAPPDPPLEEVHGPFRATSANPSDVDLQLGTLEFFGAPLEGRVAHNLAATLPLRRSSEPFTQALTMPLQSTQQLTAQTPGLAVLKHDGVTERVAVLGTTHTITPDRWLVAYAVGPQHLLSRDSDVDPGTPQAVSAAYSATPSPGAYLSWKTPHLPQDVQLWRYVFVSNGTHRSGYISYDGGFLATQFLQQIVTGETAGAVQTAFVPAVSLGSGTWVMWVAYTSNPAANGGVDTEIFREGQPCLLGTVVVP